MSVLKLRILLADDHGATNTVLSHMLSRRGHRVESVLTGQEAAQLVQIYRYDLVISDLGLPDIDGWTLLTQLREHQPALKAIAMSGYGFSEEIDRSRRAGFALHLAKPVNMPRLEAAIESIFLPERIRHETCQRTG
jgi:CheY-like chemotaxis protein